MRAETDPLRPPLSELREFEAYLRQLKLWRSAAFHEPTAAARTDELAQALFAVRGKVTDDELLQHPLGRRSASLRLLAWWADYADAKRDHVVKQQIAAARRRDAAIDELRAAEVEFDEATAAAKALAEELGPLTPTAKGSENYGF